MRLALQGRLALAAMYMDETSLDEECNVMVVTQSLGKALSMGISIRKASYRKAMWHVPFLMAVLSGLPMLATGNDPQTGKFGLRSQQLRY